MHQLATLLKTRVWNQVSTKLDNLSFVWDLVFFGSAANLLVKNMRKKNKFAEKIKKDFCEKTNV